MQATIEKHVRVNTYVLLRSCRVYVNTKPWNIRGTARSQQQRLDTNKENQQTWVSSDLSLYVDQLPITYKYMYIYIYVYTYILYLYAADYFQLIACHG